MKTIKTLTHVIGTVFIMLLAFSAQQVYAGGAHSGGHDESNAVLEDARKQHSEHEHGHDFKAMESMSPEQLGRVIALMQDIGLVVPKMDSARGRKLFVNTGCILCHSVNGVGRDVGPSLNASDMPSPMNAFEFAARMWRGAESMAALQKEMLGGVIPLTGQDLANLIAFAHDKSEQKKLTAEQIPEKFREKLHHD